MKKFVIKFMDTFVTVVAVLIIFSGVFFGITWPSTPFLIGAVVGGAIGVLISGMMFGIWMILSSIHDQLVLLVAQKKRVDKASDTE